MEKSLRITSFFSQFDTKVKTATIELCKAISQTKADLYILMARKAACFFDCLNELGLVQFNGLVCSDRILEMDCSWLKNKKVIIIDDAIISGTTIYETLQKLDKIGVRELEVYVLATNIKYYQKDLLADEFGNSYLKKPYQELNDQECIKMCADIINALSKYIRPYSVDFPVFKNIRIAESEYVNILTSSDWAIDDISTANQENENTKVLTFSPDDYITDHFEEILGMEFSKISIFKVRLYIKKINQSNEVFYNFCVLPVVVLRPTYEATVDKIFDHFVENKSHRFRKNFSSTLSKIHFIQYVTAGILAELWFDSIKPFFKKIIKFESDDFNNSLLFSPKIASLVPNSVAFHFKQKDRKKMRGSLKAIPDDKIEEDLPKLHPTIDTLLGMHVSLTQPFLDLYHKEELRSRELVLKHGRKVFQMPEFKEIINRLKRGFSFNYLQNIIDSISIFKNDFHSFGFDKKKFLSLFLDKSIDLGIVVPIVAEKESNGVKYFYRAYRHGEDVIFGEIEFLLCTLLLDSYVKASKKRDALIPHLVAEKLIVLFIKIGIRKNIFTQFISNLPNINSLKIEGIASVRNYLFGQVATFKLYDKNSQNDLPVYINHETSSSWITQKLISKNLVVIDANSGLYQIGDIEFGNLDKSKKDETTIIGGFFGELMISGKSSLLKENDLVTLTSCIDVRDIAGSLAAEIVIFNNGWPDFNSYFETNNRNRYRYFLVATNIRRHPHYRTLFTAINSGQDKYIRYKQNKGIQLIQAVEQNLETEKPRDAAIWSTFWSPNLTEQKGDANPTLDKLIDQEGSWLLKINLLYRVLEYSLRKLSIIQRELINEKNRAFLLSLVQKEFEKKDFSGMEGDYETGTSEQLESLISTEFQIGEPPVSISNSISDEVLMERLKVSNDKAVKSLLVEIDLYISKIKHIGCPINFHYDNFSPFHKNIGSLEEAELRTLLWESVENINAFFVESKLIIGEVDANVKPYGAVIIKQDYANAVFFDIDNNTRKISSQLFSDIKNHVRKNKKNLFSKERDSAEISCFFIDGRDSFMQKGLWLFVSELSSETALINATFSIQNSFANQVKITACIFKNLKKEHVVTRSGLNNKVIYPKYFWEMAEFFIANSAQLFEKPDIMIVTSKSEYRKDIKHAEKIISTVLGKEFLRHKINNLFSEKPFPHEAFVVAYSILQPKTRERISLVTENSSDTFVSQKQEFDIGIIAIKDTELSVLLKGLENVQGDVKAPSLKKYYSATLPGLNVIHKIVFCKQPDMGNVSSANMYNLMMEDFNPKLVIVFGTAGGYEDKTKLCDVVIPDKVIYYEIGKQKKTGVNREVFVYRLNQIFKDHFISDFFARNGGDEIKLNATEDSLEQTFTLSQGVIGSGEKIIEDESSDIRGWLRIVDRKSAAFEMECAGTFIANEFREVFYNQKGLGVLPIRAIADYGNPKKTNTDTEKYRVPALKNALIVLKKLLSTVPNLNNIVQEIFTRKS